MPFDLPFDYLLATGAWVVVLAGSLPLFVAVRRRAASRQSGKTPRQPARWANLGLSVWMFLATLTAVELYFAIVYDRSDVVNATNVSKHWFKRHVEPDQKILRFSDGRQTIYRDMREFRKTFGAGQRQICFVGDSFTFGHGVARVGDRFSDLVGASLDWQAPGRFVVSNLADAGRDLRWVELLLQEIVADRLPVHIVVWIDKCRTDYVTDCTIAVGESTARLIVPRLRSYRSGGASGKTFRAGTCRVCRAAARWRAKRTSILIPSVCWPTRLELFPNCCSWIGDGVACSASNGARFENPG